MSQFIFPPVTTTIDSESSDGGALPSSIMIVGGYDGANAQVIKTDSDGNLQVDVISSTGPTGFATSALQTAGNNILTTIDADTSSLAGAVSGTEVQVDVVASLPAGTNAIGKLSANSGIDIGDVDVLSSALPTGAATSALQTTANGILTTIDADTSLLAGAVSGTEVQVDIVASLPAGSNAIGKLSANSGVDIGDVDVLSLPSLPAGSNNIGDVDVLSLPALPSGTNTIGTVVVGAIAPVDFLDSGLIDTSTANIASTGTVVVASLAAICNEIEIQEDIGEFMSMRVGGAVKAYLPLGGGRVKVTLAATDAVQLYSETGTAIASGKIAINFLG
tara:strand:- start:1887 stop:2885 length:999 start_codon:yes stop_codon:yes gene_type:complete